MSAAAGRVDEARLLQTEYVERWGDRPVQDEVHHEPRRPAQGVALARELREVLVEIAEKAGIPLRVHEVVAQLAGGVVAVLKEMQNRHRLRAGRRQRPQRVVRAVEQPDRKSTRLNSSHANISY